MRRILVPLDGSPEAEGALAPAAAAAARTGAALTLVTVHEPAAAHLGLDDLSAAFVAIDQEVRDDERAYLASKVRQARMVHQNRLRAVLLEGRPGDKLIEFANEEEFDLIAMTTHGRSALSRLWLGSTAEEVVKRADPPVLLLRPGAAAGRSDLLFDRVLVPLDGSQRAESALASVAEYLSPSGILHLFTVVKPPVLFAPPARPGAPSDAKVSRRQKVIAYRYLRRIARRMRGCGRAVALHVAEAFVVSREIVRYANAERIELIVIATHARGGPARWALGSVADKIVRAGSCPVLVCRSRAADDKASEEYRAAITEYTPVACAVAGGMP